MKKLLKGKELLKKVEYDVHKLTKYGYVLANDGCSRRVYINKKTRLVIKEPIITDRKPKDAIKTLTIRRNNQTFLIQPLANCDYWSASTNAYHKLLPKHRYTNDFKESNVGIYRNKAVIIDW